MVAGESLDVVEIHLHAVGLAGVRGAHVAYWACKKCKTKVDQDTGCCKKQSTHGCATEQEEVQRGRVRKYIIVEKYAFALFTDQPPAHCALGGFDRAPGESVGE